MKSTQSPIPPLEKLNNLLATGAVTQQEYDILKGKLLQSGPEQTAPSDEGAAGTDKASTLTQLEVDHLLDGSPVESQQEEPKPAVIYPDRPLLEPVPPAEPPALKRFEPRPGNVLRFNPLRGREPEPRWFEGSTLNYVLLGSVLILLLFVGYLFSDLNGFRSDQTLRTYSDRAGGVTTGTDNNGAVYPAAAAQASGYGISPEPDDAQETEPTSEASSDQEVQAPVLDKEAADTVAVAKPVAVAETAVVATPAQPETESAEISPTNRTSPAESEIPKTENAPALPAEPGLRSQPAEPSQASRESDLGDLIRIGNRLESFYADFQAKPLAAYTHFAPQVEQYQSLTNVTPLEIKYNVEQRHFEEFLEARSSFDPGSIQIVNRNNGVIEVVFVETGEAFRKSLNQRQKTTARIRAKFDQDFRMTYFRQERILTNETIP